MPTKFSLEPPQQGLYSFSLGLGEGISFPLPLKIQCKYLHGVDLNLSLAVVSALEPRTSAYLLEKP